MRKYLSFLYFLGGGGLKFAVNCKKRFRRGRFFCFKLLQRCAYTKHSAQNLVWERSSFPFLMHCLGYTAQLCRGRVSLPDFGRVIYGMMRNLIEIVFLLCFQNLLAYGLTLFGFVGFVWLCFQNLLRLRSQILKRVTFV